MQETEEGGEDEGERDDLTWHIAYIHSDLRSPII